MFYFVAKCGSREKRFSHEKSTRGPPFGEAESNGPVGTDEVPGRMLRKRCTLRSRTRQCLVMIDPFLAFAPRRKPPGVPGGGKRRREPPFGEAESDGPVGTDEVFVPKRRTFSDLGRTSFWSSLSAAERRLFHGKVWTSKVFGPEKHAPKHGQGMKSCFFIFSERKAVGKAPCRMRAGFKAEKGPESNSTHSFPGPNVDITRGICEFPQECVVSRG